MGDELPQQLPDGFDDMAPGPALAVVLATIDRSRLCWVRRANLDTLCRHHHRLKHAKNLTLHHLGHGIYEWQAPTGRRWTVPADRTALLTTDETANHDDP